MTRVKFMQMNTVIMPDPSGNGDHDILITALDLDGKVWTKWYSHPNSEWKIVDSPFVPGPPPFRFGDE